MKKILVVAVAVVGLAAIGSRSELAPSRVALVSPAWAAEHANDPMVRILDVRPNAYDYFVSHLPNAIHLPEGVMRGPSAGVPVQYHEVDFLAQFFMRAGVRSDQRVVVYSNEMDVLGATMLAYLLERLGHTDIALVDGGWTAVPAGAGTQEYPKYERGTMEVADKRQATSVTLDELKGLMGKSGVVVVDARPAAHYRGETRVWMRNGHIPGALNLEWRTLTVSANAHALKPVSELKAIVEAAGLKPSDDIILYCGTSREASLEYFVLKHLLAFPKVRLYEGSWAEYAARQEMPVATGSERGEPRR